MTKAKFVVLIIIGAVIGYVISWGKADADRASEILANMEGSAFESCLDFNETAKRFEQEDEMIDCEKEYPQ